MSESSFSRILDRTVIECRWTDVSDRWIEYVPEIDPPGSVPEEGLSDFISFIEVANEIGKSYDTPIKKDVEGLREYVFLEGVVLLHKAIHVSELAETQAKRGYLSWSLVNSYSAALFGAKSILHFCGFALAEFDSKAVFVDIFPKEEDTHKRRAKLKLRLLDDPAIQFTKFSMQFQHRHVWKLFQRMLNVYQIGAWPDEYTVALTKLATGEFAKQRNDLNYKNNFWLYDDLHEPVLESSFGEYPDGVVDSLAYKSKSSFSLGLSLTILNMAIALFSDICSKTSVLDPELEIVMSKMSVENHPLYRAAFACP